MCFPSFSQTAEQLYADSLLHLAQNAGTDSLKIQRYLELSYFWSDRDSSEAFYYLREAEQMMPSKSNYYRGLYHFYLAGIYFDREIEKAKDDYLKADSLLKPLDNKYVFQLRARLWNNYGALLQRQDQEEKYIQILLDQAIPLAGKGEDSVLVAHDYQNVAMILMNIGDYEKAEEYYEKAIHYLSNSEGAYEEKLTVFVNAAKNAIFSRQFPEAKVYLDSAALHLKAIPHSLYASVFYQASGTYYRHQKMWQVSLQQFDKALQLARAYDDQRLVSAILFEKYQLYKETGDLAAARAALLSSRQQGSTTSNSHDRMLHLRELAKLDAQLKDYASAYNWLTAYTTLADSVFEAESHLSILELENKYRSVEKENEILLLKNENQQQQFSLERSKLTLVILLGVLLIILLLVLFGWRLYTSKKRTMEQNEILHQQELKSIKQREQLTVYNAMLQGQEQERNRIARDLHDGLGGMLAGVKLKLSSIVSKEKQKSNLISPDMEIYKVIHQLDQSVDELRRIARNMMPESLIYMGLEPALSDLCKSLNTEKTSVVFEAFDLRDSYGQELQITVYRIIQELLTNAIKHADAHTIMVQCSENEQRLYITVEDDGKGFDPEAVVQREGIGLSNIKNRVNLLQGLIEISSRSGEGTTFSIEIPLHEK
ncbi:MAG TPA: ATP-binding protein [Cyclobacteriaceae bacterium]|nr:ATP-binding protein [Cyclobacteriaceae bacterium]